MAIGVNGGHLRLGSIVAFFVAAAFGLWDLRRWGWVLAMGIWVVSLVFAFGDVPWMLIWGVAILVLLTSYGSFQPFWIRLRRGFARRRLA